MSIISFTLTQRALSLIEGVGSARRCCSDEEGEGAKEHKGRRINCIKQQQMHREVVQILTDLSLQTPSANTAQGNSK